MIVTESWNFKRKFIIKHQANIEPISAQANPRKFEISQDGEIYSFVKNDNSNRILYKSNQKVLESITKRKGSTLNNYIKIYNEEINIKLAWACLHTLLLLINKPNPPSLMGEITFLYSI